MEELKVFAKWLHDQYEEIARGIGWDTQDSCKVEFEDLPSANQKVIIELACRIRIRHEPEVLAKGYAQKQGLEEYNYGELGNSIEVCSITIFTDDIPVSIHKREE